MLGGTDEVMAAVRGGEMANVLNFLENTDAKKAVQLSDEVRMAPVTCCVISLPLWELRLS